MTNRTLGESYIQTGFARAIVVRLHIKKSNVTVDFFRIEWNPLLSVHGNIETVLETFLQSIL